MPHYVMTIGGTSLSISWPKWMNSGETGLHYEDFETRDIAPDKCKIRIEVRDGDLEIIGEEQVFSTVDSWRLYRKGDGYLVHWGPDEFRWGARVGNDFCHAEVWPGSFRQGPGEDGAVRFAQRPVDLLLLLHYLLDNNGMIVHAAGGEIMGKGILFPAVSGGGKSTLSHLANAIDGNRLYSDDRIIIKQCREGWKLYGTPWPGDEEIALAENHPLDAVVFLTHADSTEIRPLSKAEALSRILRVCSIPWYDRQRVHGGMSLCETLLREVPLYELAFTPDISAVNALDKLCRSL